MTAAEAIRAIDARYLAAKAAKTAKAQILHSTPTTTFPLKSTETRPTT